MERALGARGATMLHDKNEPSTAMDYLELARASFAQVRATRDAPHGPCPGAHGADLPREGKGLAREAIAERRSAGVA
jgi:hypothetical protein